MAIEQKPGWKTSEFWITIGFIVAETLTAIAKPEIVSAKLAVILGAIATGIYTIARTAVKTQPVSK